MPKLTSMHFYAWKAGLKTGMYYLRSRPRSDAIQFTVDQLALAEARATTAVVGGAFLSGKPIVALGSGASSGGSPGAAAAAGTAAALVVAPMSSPNSPAAAGGGGAGDSDSSAESSRDSSPVALVGFLTPTSVRSSSGLVGKGAAQAAAPLPSASAEGGSPGLPSEAPVALSEDDRLMAIAAAKAAERKKMREEMEALDGGSDVCLNCGS